jgi:uncharacterized protein (DUF4213/DUF364 family)
MKRIVKMWEIYDALIDLIPEDQVLEDCLVGLNWILARSRAGLGLAMTPPERSGPMPLAGSIAGMSLRRLAQKVKSWNNLEAALGLAAINSFYNAPETLTESFDWPAGQLPGGNAFDLMRKRAQGKKVTVVGHFPNLESMAAICDLTILERRPLRGDLPDPACEYILPGQDYVFITATTLINKTLPRLLELSRGARVVLTGPSTPLTPLLFGYGVDMLAGLVVDDQTAIFQLLKEGGQHEFFDHGTRMLTLGREQVREGACL